MVHLPNYSTRDDQWYVYQFTPDDQWYVYKVSQHEMINGTYLFIPNDQWCTFTNLLQMINGTFTKFLNMR